MHLPARPSALVALLATAACARPVPPDPAPPPAAPTEDARRPAAQSAPALKTLAIAELGLHLEVPVTWEIESGAGGHQLRPPASEPTAAAVWLLQAQRTTRAGGQIDDALALKARLLDELKQVDPAGALLRTLAYARDGVDGVRLETRFRRDKVSWRKDQLLINRGDQVLSLSMAAPDDRVDALASTWEQILQSLRFAPPAAP